VGICSVGSLKPSIGVGALMVCDDFWAPADLRRVYSDFRAHFMPAFDAPLREAVLRILRGAGLHPIPHGVYGNARGPRFETKAEIRMMADYCDIVGMTAAHEVSACCEVGLPYAILCCVDNYANGVGQEQLTLEAFHTAQAANLLTVEKCVQALLDHLPSEASLARPPAAAAAAAAHAPAPAASSPPATPSGGAGAEPVAPEPVDLVVYGRWVVPVAAGRETQVLDRHAVVVKGGLIHDILPAGDVPARYTPTRAVHLGDDHALMPGLVDAHTHLALNMLRGVADDLPLAQWLSEQIWPTEARLVDEDFVRAGTRAACAELIRGGVTTINEMYWFPESVAEVLEEVGMRGLVAMVVLEFPSRYAANADDYIAKGLAIRERWAKKAGASGRVTFGFGPHAPYTVADSSFAKIRDAATEIGCRVHIHLHETAGEVLASKTGGKEGTSKHLSDELTSPLANLDRLGLLNDRLIAVHMTCLDDAEIKRLAASGTHVIHCPNSNMKLASGFCPVDKLIKAGVNVAIGTDSASSNNSLDMWSELKLTAVLAKGVAGDATAVPAWQALRMGTLNGARALGLESVTGSLEVGKAADLIAINLAGRIETEPMFNVLSHLVYATDRSAVTDVWVGGQQLLADRNLTTIDEAGVLGMLREWGHKVRPGQTAHDRSVTIEAEHRRGHHHHHHHGHGAHGGQ
jgi:5-methylthioadenosine/S-adenosylhomocysteine deaminase